MTPPPRPVALILGAAEGLGAAFARVFDEAGYRLVLVDHAPAPLRALADALPDAVAEPLDLAAPSLAAELERLFAAYDPQVLIYNACYSRPAAFLGLSLDDKLRTLDVNARGPLIACHVAARRFAARGRGAIVLVSSLSALQGTAQVGTYAATKAFDLVLGESLWEELRPRGVDVLVVLAGAMSTPGFERITPPDRRSLAMPMSPEAVARGAFAAIGRGPTWIPGWHNRAAALIGRALPRRRAVAWFSGRTRQMYPSLEDESDSST